MQKYRAQVKIFYVIQVEFELPEGSDQDTIKIQAEIEAKKQYSDAECEVIEIETCIKTHHFEGTII